MTPEQAAQLAEVAGAVKELHRFAPRAVRPIGREEVYIVVDGGTGRRWVQDGDRMHGLELAYGLRIQEWALEDVVAIPLIGDESPGMAEFLASR